MKATIALIADNEAENIGRKMMIISFISFAIGGASFESYQKAYEELVKQDYKKSFRFSKLGLLYYDDDNIKPGTYFCYKVCEL